MKAYKLATALTIGTFCISALTGILIFFEIATGGVRATHEWISLAFVSAGVLHIVTHKKNFFRYFRDRHVILIALVLIIGGMVFVGSMNDIYSSGESFERMVNTKIEHVAPLFNLDPEGLVKEINHMNLKVSGTSQTLSEIAKANKVETYEILEPLFSKKH